MTHKEKCKQLKAVRKEMADQIGVDLHQTECTYQGECKGTCPKCAQEEKTLNRALTSGKVAVAGLALSALTLTTGCTPADVVTTVAEKLTGNTTEEMILEGEVAYTTEDTELAGDVEMDPSWTEACTTEECSTEEALEGEVAYEPVTEEDILEICRNYSGAPIVEIDHTEENGTIVYVHCYEIVENDEEGHTATWDWITIDTIAEKGTDMMGNEFNIWEYRGQ